MIDEIRIDHPTSGIVVITLNRPKRLNALTYNLASELDRLLNEISDDLDCRVVILTGADKGFCAGFDLKGAGAVVERDDLNPVEEGMIGQQTLSRLMLRMRELRQPVISAINGPAVGGGFALALSSDIRIASESASFATAFVKVGLSGCDMGVSYLLPRLIGASQAFEMILTGRKISAHEAHDLGLVSRVVPHDSLLKAALSLAEAICKNNRFGVWMTKEVMWANLETPSLRTAVALEDRTQVAAISTGELAKTIAAFRG